MTSAFLKSFELTINIIRNNVEANISYGCGHCLPTFFCAISHWKLFAPQKYVWSSCKEFLVPAIARNNVSLYYWDRPFGGWCIPADPTVLILTFRLWIPNSVQTKLSQLKIFTPPCPSQTVPMLCACDPREISTNGVRKVHPE